MSALVPLEAGYLLLLISSVLSSLKCHILDLGRAYQARQRWEVQMAEVKVSWLKVLRLGDSELGVFLILSHNFWCLVIVEVALHL